MGSTLAGQVTQDRTGAVCSEGMKLEAGNAPKRKETGSQWPECETLMTSLMSVVGETTGPAGGTASTEGGTGHSESSGESHTSVTAKKGAFGDRLTIPLEANSEPTEAVEG